MILDYSNGILTLECPNCRTVRQVSVPNNPITPLFEGDARLPALRLPPCPKCRTWTFLNPDLPTAAEDMKLANDIPDWEWKQRTIVRALTSALKANKPLPKTVPPIPKEVKHHASES